MNEEDIITLSILTGIDDIYELYAEGKINLETAALRLGAFLDSKGDLNSSLTVLYTLNNWRR